MPESQFFKCGCALRDENSSSIWVTPVLRRCKKHQNEMKKCSWLMWIKLYAPKQYRQFIKENPRSFRKRKII